MEGLCSIVADGELRPYPGEPWMSDSVVWLTTGDCELFLPTHTVCLEIDPLWAAAEPFQMSALMQMSGQLMRHQQQETTKWWVARNPIPFRTVAGIVVANRDWTEKTRYGSATYDGQRLNLLPTR